MLVKQAFPIALIHVPVKRAKTLDAAKVAKIAKIAESMLEVGQTTPIRVRTDGDKIRADRGAGTNPTRTSSSNRPSIVRDATANLGGGFVSLFAIRVVH